MLAACSLQVGILAAGHLVQVNLGAAGLRRDVKRRVILPHLFPVIGELVQRGEVQARVARGVLQRGDDRVEVRLAGAAGHGGDGEVHHVHAGFARLQDARGGDAAGIVRVKVDRQANLFLQRLDELARGERPAQARHVLDARKWAPIFSSSRAIRT